MAFTSFYKPGNPRSGKTKRGEQLPEKLYSIEGPEAFLAELSLHSRHPIESHIETLLIYEFKEIYYSERSLLEILK